MKMEKRKDRKLTREEHLELAFELVRQAHVILDDFCSECELCVLRKRCVLQLRPSRWN